MWDLKFLDQGLNLCLRHCKADCCHCSLSSCGSHRLSCICVCSWVGFPAPHPALTDSCLVYWSGIWGTSWLLTYYFISAATDVCHCTMTGFVAPTPVAWQLRFPGGKDTGSRLWLCVCSQQWLASPSQFLCHWAGLSGLLPGNPSFSWLPCGGQWRRAGEWARVPLRIGHPVGKLLCQPLPFGNLLNI